MPRRGLRRDDYAADIPGSDADTPRPNVAYLCDGEPFNPEKEGYWLVYPHDSDPAHEGQHAPDRSIRQLVSLRREG